MNVKKLLFNNVIRGGGDTPSPIAALITDSLYTHLDGKDISGENWHDRMGHYDFTTSSTISSSENRFNLYGHTATSTNFTFGSFPFTLEFAVNITETQSWGRLFSAKTPNDFKVCFRNNGYYGIYSTHMVPTSINYGILGSSVNDATLHIIDFVFVSSNELIIYLDGVKQADVKTNVFNTSMLGLYNYHFGGTEPDNRIIGYVYSFRFYKKALSEYEVRCNCLYEATQGRNSVASDTEQSYFLEKWN